MRLKWLLTLFLVLGTASVAHAQSNITIDLGVTYNSGFVEITPLNPQGYNGNIQQSTVYSKILSSLGVTTITTLASGQQYRFMVCKSDGSACLLATVNVTGEAQDISSQLESYEIGSGSGAGTVTNIATSSPIGGGPITTTGTLTCTTCTTNASAATSGLFMVGAGLQAIAASSHLNYGVTTALTLTTDSAFAALSLSTTNDGVHAGLLSLPGNTTVPASYPANSFGFVGPNSASFTSWFIRPTATAPAASCVPVLGAAASNVSALTCGAQYLTGSCTELWGGSGTSFALTSGDDAISNNSCYNDSGVTRTITAVKCRSDHGTNTTTVHPTFGAAGTGTTILSGALTCGSSLAYSSSGTVSNASWTTGTGITPVMGGTLTGTSIAMIVEYTY